MTPAASAGKTFLVLGDSGMAGHVLSTYLRDAGHEVLGLSGHTRVRDDSKLVDVFDQPRLLSFLRSNRPDVVVNCIGALVRESAAQHDRAAYLNAYLPHLLEHEYANSATRVFHLSTDCVFSGREGGYFETSIRDGEAFYDRSKALGELENTKDLTLRTSIIGPEVRATATGLMNWVLSARGVVEGYQAAKWNGLTTLQLAKEIELLSRSRGIAGVVHPVPRTIVSKYELLVLMVDVFGLSDLSIRPVEGKRVDKSLRSTRTDYTPPDVDHRDMLLELREWMLRHANLYCNLNWFNRIRGASDADKTEGA